MIRSILGKSRPRAATSVAIRQLVLPSLKALNTTSRCS